MSALSVHRETAEGCGWDELVRVWEETHGPEGSAVEVVEGIITVTPRPSNMHNDIADLVHRLLYTVVPREWGVYQTLGVGLPSRGHLFIPDLVVVPRAALAERGTYVPATAAELVVEITSPYNARHDRLSKAAGYAQAGIPLYLLVDGYAPGGAAVTLYGEPEGDVYRVLQTGKYGERVRLPEPFGITVDSGEFPRP